MQKSNLSSWLSDIPMFSVLTGDQLTALADSSPLEPLMRGSTLFNRGESARGLCVLVHGQIKLAISSSHGNEKVISIIQPGEIFGEDCICLERPLPVYAQAINNSEVLVIPKRVILSLMDQNPQVAKKMVEALSDRMHKLFHDIEMISLQSSTERLIGYLLQISASKHYASRLTLPTSKVTIASLLNLTPETLSRTMSKLQQAGLIEVDGNEVAIDVPGLREFA